MVRKDKVVSFREIKRVEFNIGTDIRKVIQEAIDYAIINNCIVKFIFNGYNFEVSKYSQLNSLMDEYKCFQVEFTGYETIPSYVKLDINDNIIEIQGMKLDKPVKFNLQFGNYEQPMGPTGSIKKLILQEKAEIKK